MAGIFIFSDLHGSGEAACAVAEALARRGGAKAVERVVFCGDAFNPGRSPIAARLLADFEKSGKFVAVEGNCDGDPEEDDLAYSMVPEYALVEAGGHRLFVTHGDRWHPWRLPPAGVCDVMVYGHRHLPDARKLEAEGLVLFNPGSCASPRGGWVPSYGWLENGRMDVCQLSDDRVMLEVPVE